VNASFIHSILLFLFPCFRHHRDLHSFPTRRSSDLSKSAIPQLASAAMNQGRPGRFLRWAYQAKVMNTFESVSSAIATSAGGRFKDRKSTRLNSSHVKISYAVFCLKKKKKVYQKCK